MTMSRDAWYRNPEVLYNFISIAKDREICFIPKKAGEGSYPVRHIFANYMKFLSANFDAFKFYNRPYNLYYSLARYQGLRLFSFNPTIRKSQSDSWNKDAVNNTVAYDFGLDFDSEGLHDWKSAWRDAAKVKKVFDEYKVPYSIKFSGSKGFHIRVPYEALPQSKVITGSVDNPESLFIYLKSVAELLVEKYELPTLDLGIFDPRRVWKMEYSLTHETGLVVLPLSDEQFDRFEPAMCDPLTVLKGGIRNRGSLERRGEPGAFSKMLYKELGLE